ncbi:hypothetical protein MACH16_21200 [Marinomonas pontica]|uniref:Prepilin-type N-terminal cleavage/methylation domain-containing protein n=1 Tax=Marinomonas pontica TaxID=264739 RepID=A0ABN6WNG4_9GAMM|nr:hypothetical protein MACH16_21200 [Marinomonas pontica]
MTFLHRLSIHSKSRQSGWILLEVMLCLVLFAVVLRVSQQQTQGQWQSVQRAEERRKSYDNTLKQAAMAQLVGSVSWLEGSPEVVKIEYPDCLQCTGSQLQNWFYATQYFFPESTVLALAEEDAQ